MEQANIPSVAKAFSDCAQIISGLPTDEQRQTVLQLLRTLLDSIPQPRVQASLRLLPEAQATTELVSANAVDDERIEMAIRFSSRDGGVLSERFLFAALALDLKEPDSWFTGANLNKYLAPFRAEVRNVTNAVAPLVENRYLRQRKQGPFWYYTLTEQGRAAALNKVAHYQ